MADITTSPVVTPIIPKPVAKDTASVPDPKADTTVATAPKADTSPPVDPPKPATDPKVADAIKTQAMAQAKTAGNSLPAADINALLSRFC